MISAQKNKNVREDKYFFQKKDMAEMIPMNQSNYSRIERNTGSEYASVQRHCRNTLPQLKQTVRNKTNRYAKKMIKQST